jgi:major intracellular serine protease
MPTFNWNQSLLGLPPEWRATRGAGVKIALLDSGFDLSHPALAHLDVAGRTFDAGRPGFRPQARLVGEDDVSDRSPLDKPLHGTQCASVLAAQDASADGLIGVAPDAEIYLLRVTDPASETFLEQFVKAVTLALIKDVDIIAASYFPTFQAAPDFAVLGELFGKIRENRVFLVTTLENTGRMDRLNGLKFPSNQPESIVAGAATSRLLTPLPAGHLFSPAIRFLLPEQRVRGCAANGQYDDNRTLSSSLATSALAGALALALADWRQNHAPTERPTRDEALNLLHQIATPYEPAGILADPTLQFFNPHLLGV